MVARASGFSIISITEMLLLMRKWWEERGRGRGRSRPIEAGAIVAPRIPFEVAAFDQQDYLARLSMRLCREKKKQEREAVIYI
jgi:hypothetical protein